jgi:hypothetical protein
VGQISFFTAAQTAAMRDPTKRRNYSVEAEEFRREHAARRDWGLQQRHTRKMRRLFGSTTAAWAAFHERIEELQSPACPAPADDQAGSPARTASVPVTETPPARPVPALPETALPAAARPAPIPPETIPPETALPKNALPAAARPGTGLPRTGLPGTGSTQVEHIPAASGPSAPEVLTPEAIPAETATAEPTRGHRGRTSPVSGRPTPTTRAAPIAAEPTTAEPQSARRAAEVSTTSCVPGGDHPARRNPPRPASRCPAAEKTPPHPGGNARTDQTRRRGPGRQKQTPSGQHRHAESGPQQTYDNPPGNNRSLRRHEAISADVAHYCGHERPEQPAEWYFRFEGALSSTDPGVGLATESGGAGIASPGGRPYAVDDRSVYVAGLGWDVEWPSTEWIRYHYRPDHCSGASAPVHHSETSPQQALVGERPWHPRAAEPQEEPKRETMQGPRARNPTQKARPTQQRIDRAKADSPTY